MKIPAHYRNVGKTKRFEIENITTLDDYPQIEGYDFSQTFAIDTFLQKYFTTGFQATHLGQAIQIVNRMLEDKATIYLSFTSNVISSGLREQICFLAQHKLVHVLCTTAGGIEEDVIKCFKPFVVGDFAAPGRYLFDKGVGRIGNIFVPNDRYLYFEEFMNSFFEKMYEKQKKEKSNIHPSLLLKELGLFLNNDASYLSWAARNNIKVFCPALLDGAFGDMLYFFKKRHPDFKIELTKDIEDIVDFTLQQEKTGVICLGGGTSKHFVLNANIFKDGFDYAVYLTTALEHDGSDSGGSPEEALTWAKLKPNAPRVKVFCDATIAFPLVLAGSFAKKVEKKAVKKEAHLQENKSIHSKKQ